MSAEETALLALIGAVAFLDRWQVGQTMVSRPIVVGVLVGIVLDQPGRGALWGAVFETMYIGILPVGAARVPDTALAALVGTTVALGGPSSAAPAGLAVGLAILAGELGVEADRRLRRWNGRAAARVRERVGRGDTGAPGRAVALALVLGAALGALEAALGVVLAREVLGYVGASAWAGPLEEGVVVLATVGALAAVGARTFAGAGRRRLLWGAGAVLGALVVWAGA